MLFGKLRRYMKGCFIQKLKEMCENAFKRCIRERYVLC